MSRKILQKIDRGFGDSSETVRNEANTNCQCFVCNANVQDRHYLVGTCKTRSSGTTISEKLGELIGERYMIVIREDDVICRSCVNLLETLDRLGKQMKDIRTVILQFLEFKYSLDKGDLTSRVDDPRVQIESSQSSSNDTNSEKNVALSFDSQNSEESTLLRCERCQYTTNSYTFMIFHIRSHKNENMHSDESISKEQPTTENQNVDKELEMTKDLGNKDRIALESSDVTGIADVLKKRPKLSGSRINLKNLMQKNVRLVWLDHAKKTQLQKLAMNGNAGSKPIFIRVLPKTTVDQQEFSSLESGVDVKLSDNTNELENSSTDNKLGDKGSEQLSDEIDSQNLEMEYWDEEG